MTPEQREKLDGLTYQLVDYTLLQYWVRADGALMRTSAPWLKVVAAPKEWPSGLAENDRAMAREILDAATAGFRRHYLHPVAGDPGWKFIDGFWCMPKGNTATFKSVSDWDHVQEREAFMRETDALMVALLKDESARIQRMVEALAASPIRGQKKHLGTGSDASLAVEPEHHASVETTLENKPRDRESKGLLSEAVEAISDLQQYRHRLEDHVITEATLISQYLRQVLGTEEFEQIRSAGIPVGLETRHLGVLARLAHPFSSRSEQLLTMDGSVVQKPKQKGATQPDPEACAKFLLCATEISNDVLASIQQRGAAATSAISTAHSRGLTG
jgi:hypothetical protein